MKDYENILSKAEGLRQKIVDLRRDFHQHPELGLQEFNTAKKVEMVLEGLGIEKKMLVNGTGVRGYLKGSKPGKTIALRADMDALPIQEETGLPYKSQIAHKKEDKQMETWIVVAEADCIDPAHEDEFNDWYDNVHIPDCLTSPGYKSVRRYQIEKPAPGRAKYLTIYEVRTNNIEETVRMRNERRERERAIGAYSGGGQYVTGILSCYKLMRPALTKRNTPPAPYAHKANRGH